MYIGERDVWMRGVRTRISNIPARETKKNINATESLEDGYLLIGTLCATQKQVRACGSGACTGA
jgi:hypothetical protein